MRHRTFFFLEFNQLKFCNVEGEFSHPVALEYSVSVLKTSLHR